MRIISGNLRGRYINNLKNFRARPTTDMAREALFNVLANTVDFESISVLDLFSGTGLISYEFASRGCSDIVSIEKDSHHQRFINKQIKDFEIEDSIISLKADVFSYLKRAPSKKFDIIFADPPYDLSNFDEVLDLIIASKIGKENALIIIEHSAERDYSNHDNFTQVRKYGKVRFSFFTVTN